MSEVKTSNKKRKPNVNENQMLAKQKKDGTDHNKTKQDTFQ